MKLSNAQVGALASKIKKELKEKYQDPIYAANAAIRESDEYKNFFELNEDCIMLQTISDKWKVRSYRTNDTMNEIRSAYFETILKDAPSFSTEDIENEIHLATIDVQNIDELIKKVANKFAV
jgi:hypothetical protein